MHWTNNEKGEFEDPISYKVFTENTHIVCVRSSGYVYAYETIQELNKKAKYFYDLVTSTYLPTQTIPSIRPLISSPFRTPSATRHSLTSTTCVITFLSSRLKS
jgi:hypothetical protein